MIQALTALALFVAAILVVGYGLLALVLARRTSPGTARRELDLFATLGLSFVLGNFVVAGVATLLLLAGRLDLSLVALVILTLAAIAIVTMLGRHRQLLLPRVHRRDWMLLGLLCILFIPLLLAPALVHPIAWDAVGIWLLKAKAMFYQPGFPNQLFTLAGFVGIHHDYPVGIPLLIATFYRVLGHVDDAVGTAYLSCFLFATMLLIVSAVRTALQRAAVLVPLLVVLALLPTGEVFAYYANGYVDVALAAAIAATVLAIGYAVSRHDHRLLLVGWLTALFAAGIKNEGLIFFVLTSVFLAAYLGLAERSWLVSWLANVRQHAMRTTILVIGVLAALAPLIAWQIARTHFGFRSDLVSGPLPHPGMSEFTFYTDRLNQISTTTAKEVVNYVHWLWTLLPLLLAFVGLGIATLVRRGRRWFALPGGLIAAQAFAYLMVYLRTPHDLTWHLETSLDRLLLHLVPAAVICVALWLALWLDRSPRPR